MDKLLEQYIMYLQNVKKTSANTVTAYKRDLTKLIQFLSERGFSDVSKISFTDLNSYILLLEKEGAATSSISRNISTIKSFFLFLLRNRYIDNDPAQNLKAPKILKKAPRILTVEEIEVLLSLPDVSPKGLRDKAMLELLYATGLKVTELIELKLNQVNSTLQYMRIHDKDRERVIPFGEFAKQALENYLENARPILVSGMEDEEYLFLNYSGQPMTRQGFWKIIKNYGEQAGFDVGLTPHVFRHSFAAHMVENGADLKSLQELLGHSDISTTQVYSSFAHSGVNAVYQKAHPRK